jgi:hypothetical protein
MKKLMFYGLALLVAGGMAVSPACSPSKEANDIIALKEKIIALQNQGELGFRNFTICTNITGFGSYVPAASPVFKSGDQMHVYYEPDNVFTGRREGLFEVWYTQDMIVLDAKGEILLNKADALDFHYTSKLPVLDLYATNSLNFTGLPPGKYQYKAVLKDKLRNKEATKILEFRIE